MDNISTGKNIQNFGIFYTENIKGTFQLVAQIKLIIFKWFGSYDENCSGNKIGQWIELSDEFKWRQEVTNHGIYKNRNKIGKCHISYNKDDQDNICKFIIYLVMVDHTMKAVMAPRLKSGMNQTMNLGRDEKSFVMVNMKMVKKLVIRRCYFCSQIIYF
ncbi:unnamed protein product [Paramecium primaurelia]|uniref:Uncharacterized protein n=1 Tax=Paramecium primaurelia TaxID=5886 RepID=A0A8S1P5X8_PARPR|nr:unnamed protein product [Paramecium primaurelia]